MSCPRRGMESQKCDLYLRQNGYERTLSPPKADLILISTCGYVQNREDESVGILRTMVRENVSAKIIAIGCLSKINPLRLDEISSVTALSPNELDKLDEIINAEIKYRDVPDPNFIDISLFAPPKPEDLNTQNQLDIRIKIDRLVAAVQQKHVKKNIPLDAKYKKKDIFYISISTGCYGQCSYCAIKNAVGELVSKPLSTIIEEFRKGLNSGMSLFTLIGDDTGCYGLDIGTNIVCLLKEIFSHKGGYKIIIKDFNIQWLAKFYSELKELFYENAAKIDYVIFPVQSGSNRVLKLMKRPYEIEKVRELLIDLKAYVPSLRIDTAMMAGFPGESEEDVEKTLLFIRDIRFNHIWIYEYSDRPNTGSFHLTPKVPKQEIQKRARRLLEAQEEILASLEN